MVHPEYPKTWEEDSWYDGSDTKEKSDPIPQVVQVRLLIQTEAISDGDGNDNIHDPLVTSQIG